MSNGDSQLCSKKSSLCSIILSFVAGLIGAALMMFVFVSYYGSVHFGTLQPGGDTILNFGEISYTAAWEKASPAVVSIVAMKDLSQYYNQFQSFGHSTSGGLEEVSSGTAFILTKDGLAVTNKHVVEDNTAEYVAVLSDGTELSAEVLDRDPLNDVALVQLYNSDGDLPELSTFEFADSDSIQIGEPVLAIGNALGEYSNTTTAGIISAIGRNILASSGYGSAESLVDLIQTDAAINPGNSGGPLINLYGEVVGMNTAVDSTAAGIGFAIPANDVAMVVASYQEFGRIVRPFLGVRYVMVNEGIRMRLGVTAEYGALVIGDKQSGVGAIVEGSSAAKAGLQEGDVILSFEGKDLTTSFTLSNAIAGYMVGETVVLEVLRDGEVLQVLLTLEADE